MSDSSHNHTAKIWLGRAIALAGHMCAISVLSVLSVLLVIPQAAAHRIAGWVVSNDELFALTIPDVVVHVALCACLWTFVALCFTYGRQRVRTVKKVALRTARGTVITETLIVLPLFLMMTFGMSQLVVNSIAGVLMNVAAFQSARAYWVWQPEVSGGRATGVNASTKAQVAAAAVMTPVAPGDFVNATFLSGDAEKMQLALGGANIPFSEVIPADIGALIADLASLSATRATRRNMTFWRALDSQTFAQRSVTKFSHAYQSTKITPKNSSGRLGVTVTYKHNQVMPVVGRMFGTYGKVGLRDGYYAKYVRTYTYKTQLAVPNATMPSSGQNPAYPSEGSGESGIRGGVGDGDF